MPIKDIIGVINQRIVELRNKLNTHGEDKKGKKCTICADLRIRIREAHKIEELVNNIIKPLPANVCFVCGDIKFTSHKDLQEHRKTKKHRINSERNREAYPDKKYELYEEETT